MALRRVGLSVLLLALPRAAVCSSPTWSFKDFLEGEWDLEKQRDGVTTRARYVLAPAAPSGEELEGRFSELMEFGEEVVVRHDRVVFDDAAHQTGRFHFAKPPPDDDDAEEPHEFQHAFDFAFSQVLGGRGWISESPIPLSTRAPTKPASSPRGLPSAEAACPGAAARPRAARRCGASMGVH